METKSLWIKILTVVKYAIAMTIGYLGGDGTVTNFLNF